MQAFSPWAKQFLAAHVHQTAQPKARLYLALRFSIIPIFLSAFSFVTPSTSFSQAKIAGQEYQKGLVLFEAKKYDQAIAAFDAVLKLRADHEPAYQKRVEAYQKKINNLLDTGKYEEAVGAGQTALATALRQDDLKARSKLLYQIGSAHYRLGNYVLAIEVFSKSLEHAQTIGQRSHRADALNGLGLVYSHTGDLEKAGGYYKQSLEIYRELGDKSGQAIVLGNLGNLQARQQEFDQALASYEQALILLRAVKGQRAVEANIYGAIAATHAYRGDFQKSLDFDKMALKIYRELGDLDGESNQLGNIGTTYIFLGDFWQGLQYMQQALAISKKLNDKYHWQNQLGNIGNTYHQLGDNHRALESFQQAQQLAYDIKEISDEAAWLGGIGEIYFEQQQTKLAIQKFDQVLAIFRTLKDKRGQAIYFANLATAHIRENNFGQAFAYFDSSLQLDQKIENPYGVAETYNGLGALHLKNGDATKSREAHEKALAISKELQASRIIWEAQYGLAKAAEHENKFDEAKKIYLQAIANVEAVRAQLPVAELRGSFLASRTEIYKGLIYTLFRMHQQRPNAGYDLEAFYYSEKAKARALLDLLAEAKVQLQPDLPANLQAQQEATLQKIAGIQTQLQQSTPADSERTALLAELEQAERALQDLIIEIKQKNPAYAQLKYPEAVQLSDFRRRILEDKELVLAYALGEESSYLWAITAKQHLFLPLPPAADIEKTVKSYVALIDTATRISVPHQARGRELFDLLLKPAGDLVVQARKIIIIADGALHYLPFEALTLPKPVGKPEYLIQHAEIVYAPSATVLSFLHANQRARSSRQPRTLLAFADPVFNAEEIAVSSNTDRGASNALMVDSLARDSLAIDTLVEAASLRGLHELLGKKLARLPFSGAEIDSIAQFFPPSEKKIYRRQEALEERLKREELKRYAFVHFATHGILDEQHPGRSSLVLTLDSEPSEDGFVQINEIFNLKLDAELVVLSACETATGKRLPGEGLLGMTRAFLYAGAESVLGSLWNVSDKSTAKLMSRFYRHLRAGNSRSLALQLAKLDLLQSGAHRHPYYWAAFVLIGSER